MDLSVAVRLCVRAIALNSLLCVACANGDSSGGEQPELSVARAPSAAAEPAAEASLWPGGLPRELSVPPRTRPIVVYLDAGHGAENNPGNSSCFCEREQDFTLSLADDVTGSLEALGGFTVVPSRVGTLVVPYAQRVEAARAAGADVFVSVHSDIRGQGEEWSPDGTKTCMKSERAPGFSVLFSDEGSAALVTHRRALATSVSDALLDAGFLAYHGAEYVGLYEGAPSERGVFVDRHELQKRIFVLRRSTMPAIIIETHNALDPREARAFEDPTVREAFALALARALVLAARNP